MYMSQSKPDLTWGNIFYYFHCFTHMSKQDVFIGINYLEIRSHITLIAAGDLQQSFSRVSQAKRTWPDKF